MHHEGGSVSPEARWSEVPAEDRSEFCRRVGTAWRVVSGPSALLEIEEIESGRVLARFAARLSPRRAGGGQAGTVEIPE